MWLRFLTWLLFVSCTRAISSSDFHRNFSSEQTGVNPWNRDSVRTQELIAVEQKDGIIKEALRLNTKVEEKYKLSYDSRTQRGKGAYGGANVNYRHSRSTNSAASLLPWISTVSVSLALILVHLFDLC